MRVPMKKSGIWDILDRVEVEFPAPESPSSAAYEAAYGAMPYREQMRIVRTLRTIKLFDQIGGYSE